MKTRIAISLALAAATLGGQRHALAQRVAACPDANACAELAVTPEQISASSGQVTTIGVSFRQAPDNGQGGGADDVAALAFSLGLQGGRCSSASQPCLVSSDCPSGDSCELPANTPLTLADCNIGADGLPVSVRPSAALAGFRVVVENATCGAGRTHCLCPDGGSGINPDSFINLVVFGPNPLPTPGPNPVVIPKIPSGNLLNIDLRVADGAALPILLHPYNQVANPQRPQFTAFLSMGDVNAVDQTCAPVAGEPPCAGPSHTSQVVAKDATLGSTPSCIGDKGGNGSIEAPDVVATINCFAQDDLSQNPAADGSGNGSCDANEVVQVIDNFAKDECKPYQS